MRALLIEPGYKAKYPPLGLMKISTYHKERGDEVVFYKGTNLELRNQKWDIIYITTMFTYQWNTTIKTIKYYRRNEANGDIRVGGVMASLLSEDLENEIGIKPHVGLLEQVDRLPPDYSLSNNYYSNDASFGFMTKGCVNKCLYCAVPELEPVYEHYVPLGHQISPEKKDLILLDNNILASEEFPKIVEEIKEYGFYKGAKFNGRLRYVDFNQGVDARLLTDEKMKLISGLAIKPLRIAFDNIKLKDLYEEKIRLAAKYDINNLSNFVLFNFKDKPDYFYERLRINIELNEELGLSIYSFPMRYIPLYTKTRKYVGPGWNSTQLRGVQCILHATHGVVGPKRPFFEKAFGKSPEEFKHIISRPEKEIFYRDNMVPFKRRRLKKMISSLFDTAFNGRSYKTP